MKYKLPLVTVVTVNYNGKHLIKNCLDSLLALNYPEDKLEIIMVDNGSNDDSVKYTKSRYPNIKIIKNDINNYCRANNLAIAKSKGRYVALLNNDTKVDKDWLIELVSVMKMDSKAGAVGSKILFMDGRIQSAGHMECPNYYRTDKGFLEEDKGQYNELKQVESVSNCSVLYRKEALDKIGTFDEDFVMYMEDVDIAFRLKKKGWSIWYAPRSITYHTLHGSRQDAQERQFYVERNRLLFIAKYFPGRLPEYLCGFGGVVKFKYLDFIKILISIFDKLMENRDSKNNIDLLTQLQKSIETIYDYRQLSFREELENLSAGMKQEILVKEARFNSLQEILKAKDEELHHRLTESMVKDEQLKNQQETILRLEKDSQAKEINLSNLSEEIKSKDSIIETKEEYIQKQNSVIGSKEEQLKSRQEIIETLQKEIQNKVEGINSLTEELKNQEAQIKAQQEAVRDKDKQIESYLIELKVQNEQIGRHREVITAREESIGNQGLILASKDEQLKNQQETILRLEDNIRSKEARFNSLQEILKAKDEELHHRLTESMVKDEQLKNQQETILRLEKDSQAKEINLSNLSEEIKSKDSIIETKEEYIQKQNILIDSKEEQIQTLYKELLNKETQLSSLRDSLAANEEKISFKITELNIKDERLKEQENIIITLKKEIEDRDEENIRQHSELDNRNNQLNALELKISAQERSIDKQIDELKNKDEQLAGKDAVIATRNEEILRVYNSESYRLIVKPIIWPFLSFIKRLLYPLNSYVNMLRKKESGICIAQLSAQSAMAKYMQKNEYTVKIVNNNFQKEKIKLVLDIWPWMDQKHPHRHYVYFATDVIVDQRKPCLIKAVYNWEREVKFWIDNIEAPLCDFWRGDMKSFEVFMIFANLYNAENEVISSISILQRLEK